MTSPTSTTYPTCQVFPRLGRPRTRQWVISVCEWCGEKFRFLSRVHRPGDVPIGRPRAGKEREPIHPELSRRFCSGRCHLESQRDKRRKLPINPLIVIRLYRSGLSTTELSQQFGVAPRDISKYLKKHGEPRRKKGRQGATTCKIADCGKPPHKIRHAGNGSRYGTLCRWHWRLHRASLSRVYGRKIRDIPPERWRA